MIHDLVANLNVKPDAPFIDADNGQDFGSNPFEHGLRVCAVAHRDLLRAYE
jgi:hypothetical protein